MDPNIVPDITTRLHRISLKEVITPENKSDIIRPDGPCIWGYVRVSTLKQVKGGHSIQAQRDIISNYIKKNQLPEVTKIFEDAGVSGKTMITRPDFIRMKKCLRKGDTIIAVSLSRIGRNVNEISSFLQDIEKTGVTLILTEEEINTGTAMGRAFVNMMATMHQLEREQSSERTAAVMQTRKERGYLVTRPPFGTKKDPEGTNKLVSDPTEQTVIDYIAKWIFENPEIKDSEITKKLQAKYEAGEITIRKAKRVYQQTVKNIIKRYQLRDLISKELTSTQSTIRA